MNLLDKNNNTNILFAGILSIMIGMGVDRFAFTTLLTSMLEDFLNIADTSFLASVHYVGYLSGAIFSIFIKDIYAKVKYFRIGIVFSTLMTIILATTTNEFLWFISRIVAGFSSAMVFIVGSAIVMVKLNLKDKTKAMGIYFSGIGIAIVLSELIGRYVLQDGTWNDAWKVFSLLSFVLSFYCVYILSFDKKLKKDAIKYKFSLSIFSPYIILLVLAYFTEGVGFVIQATFLPDIINSLEGLNGYGSLVWMIAGISGIPSSILWMRLAHKYTSINIIIMAMSLQIIGILIPALSTNIYLNIFSGILYGSTFIGLVALFMNYGGKLAGKNPVILMGSMTTAYGIGQVSAPLYTIALMNHFGSYNSTLYLTALIVFIGIILLFFANKLKTN